MAVAEGARLSAADHPVASHVDITMWWTFTCARHAGLLEDRLRQSALRLTSLQWPLWHCFAVFPEKNRLAGAESSQRKFVLCHAFMFQSFVSRIYMAEKLFEALKYAKSLTMVAFRNHSYFYRTHLYITTYCFLLVHFSLFQPSASAVPPWTESRNCKTLVLKVFKSFTFVCEKKQVKS